MFKFSSVQFYFYGAFVTKQLHISISIPVSVNVSTNESIPNEQACGGGDKGNTPWELKRKKPPEESDSNKNSYLFDSCDTRSIASGEWWGVGVQDWVWVQERTEMGVGENAHVCMLADLGYTRRSISLTEWPFSQSQQMW